MANNATTRKLTAATQELTEAINNFTLTSLNTELIAAIVGGGLLLWATGFGIGLLVQILRRLKL